MKRFTSVFTKNFANSHYSNTMEMEKPYYATSVWDNSSDIVNSIREVPPAHYTLKIDSFSFLLQVLEKVGSKSYDTEIFEASGYKWKLCLYPNGDQERNGKGYISLYLAIQDTNALPLGWEINVNYKLFVFDQIRDKYLAIQDANGKLSRFHEMKKEWGYTQFLSQYVFYDANNGFLLHDKCVFGVEVFVNNYSGIGECLALPEKLHSTYTWKVVNCATMSDGENCSDDFVLGNRKWKISLFPKGHNKGVDNKCVALYLKFADLETTPRVFAEFKMTIKDQKNGKHKENTASYLFSESIISWGWPEFISLKDIQDPSKGFLVKDTLIVQVEMIRLLNLVCF